MIITRNGEDFTEINPLTTGQAPDFSLKDQHNNVVSLSELPSPIIISVFPNINTSVCSVQTRRFNQEAAAHKEIAFLSISNNTPEEQANWCAAEGVEMTILSDANNEFGKLYGIVMAEANLLARSVFVITYSYFEQGKSFAVTSIWRRKTNWYCEARQLTLIV